MYKTDLKILTTTWVFLIATVYKHMLFAVIQHVEITESVSARGRECHKVLMYQILKMKLGHVQKEIHKSKCLI